VCGAFIVDSVSCRVEQTIVHLEGLGGHSTKAGLRKPRQAAAVLNSIALRCGGQVWHVCPDFACPCLGMLISPTRKDGVVFDARIASAALLRVMRPCSVHEQHHHINHCCTSNPLHTVEALTLGGFLNVLCLCKPCDRHRNSPACTLAHQLAQAEAKTQRSKAALQSDSIVSSIHEAQRVYSAGNEHLFHQSQSDSVALVITAARANCNCNTCHHAWK
jgi:hypothetical protein